METEETFIMLNEKIKLAHEMVI
eukprot:SAG22_NODE_1423_length_4464_cov_2.703551_4_plen_22_part_01